MEDEALKKDILDYLTAIGVKHETVEHPAAPTVEEHTKYVGGMGGQAKQLFLKDKKGNYVLVSCLKDQEIDMKVLSERLGVKKTEPLRMVQYDVTTKMLKVAPGSVTPLSVKYCGPEIRLLLDANFKKFDKCLFHPMVCTATTLISPADTEKFLESLGRRAEWVDFSATDRIGDAPAESGGGKPAPEAPAKTAPEKKQPKAAGGGGHHAQAPAAASPAADHHHGAGGGEVHWRKKGWDWDAQGRPCGQLDVRQTWRETMYEKPRGWSGP